MLDLSKDGQDAGGAFVDLSKEAGKPVTRVVVKVKWDKQTTSGFDFDPDCSALCLDSSDKILNLDPQWFVKAFGKGSVPRSPDGKIRHGGDDTTGAQGGEKIEIDSPLSSGIAKVRVPVTIFHAAARGQNIGKIKNLTIEVEDADTNEKLVTGKLQFDASTYTSAIAVDIIPLPNGLAAHYVGEGYNGGLGDLATDVGMQIAPNNPYDHGKEPGQS